MASPLPPLWESFRIALRDRDAGALPALEGELKKQKLEVGVKMALEAFLAQARGKGPEALGRLRAAAKHRKAGPLESLALGHLLLDEGDAKGAKDAFSIAAADKLKDPRLPAGQAAALLALGEIDQAHRLAEQAVNQDPRYSFPRYVLGLVASHKSDLKAARALFEQVTHDDPEFLPGWLGYAAQSMALGKGGEIIARLTPIAAAHPQHPGVQMALADALRQAGQLDRAIEVLTPVASQSRDPGLVLDYAELCVVAGQLSVAKAALAVLQQLDPASARAHILRGQVLEQDQPKDFKGAVAAYRDALAAAPKSTRAMVALGLLLMRETEVKDWPQAEVLLRRAVELESPPSIPALLNLAILRAQQGSIAEAKALAQQVLARRPKDPSVVDQAQRIAELPSPPS